jgi:hypothetical protein
MGEMDEDLLMILMKQLEMPFDELIEFFARKHGG